MGFEIKEETNDQALSVGYVQPELQDELQPATPPISKLTFVKNYLKSMVMEPFLMLVMFALTCRSVTTQNLLRDKCCLVSFGYSEEICNDLHNENHTEIENQVQSMATNYHTATSILSLGPAIVTTIFLGSWSDIYGRKTPIIIATVGLILEAICYFLNVLAFKAPIGFMLISPISAGITGGIMVVMLSSISYLTDVTDTKNRAIRFAFFEMAFIFAGPIGTAAGGIIYKQYGYLAVFGTSITFYIVGLVYICIRLKEPDKKKLTDYKEALRSLFSFENVKSNIRTCTRPREGNIRKELWLLFASMFCTVICMMGTMAFAFFYVQKMYGWDNYYFSMVSMVFSFTTGIAIIIAVPVMTKVFKLHDATLSIIGTICMASATALKGVSYKSWEYNLASLIGILSGITNIGVRTRISKLVQKDEIGKVFSVLSLCESVTPLIGMTLFGTIYSNSISFFPGLGYIVAASFLIVPLIVFSWVYKWGSQVPCEEMTLPLTEAEMEMPGK